MPLPSPEEQEQPKPKLTPDGLPVVSRDNLHALLELSGTAQEKYQEEFEERLRRENPGLYHEINHIMQLSELGEEYLSGVGFGVMLAYESLRRQLAANKLEREINGEEQTT